MIIFYNFEKSSNSYIRVYIADQVTINYKDFSLLDVDSTRVVLRLSQISSKK
jgi:hypothetical protein